MARRGRKPKTKQQKQADALDRSAPNARVLELRRMFSFVQPPPADRLVGRNGEIDSEICDAIGQMCALGLLDNHGHDPVEMRDKGRFWGGHYAHLMKPLGVKVGSYERAAKGHPSGSLTASDMLFDRMDNALGQSFERMALLTLVVDPLIGYGETVPWAQGLIHEALLERGRVPRMMMFPTLLDRERLNAVIRGLCCLVDGSLPQRHERRAA